MRPFAERLRVRSPKTRRQSLPRWSSGGESDGRTGGGPGFCVNETHEFVLECTEGLQVQGSLTDLKAARCLGQKGK